MQEELKKEKERTGNIRKSTMSAIKKRCEKDNRVELDKHKEMFRAALSRAQMAEKKLEETRVELAKFKDMNLVATRQIKALCPRGSPLGDPGPLGDLFVDLGPLWVSFFVPRSPFSPF